MKHHDNCEMCPAFPKKPHDCGDCELCEPKPKTTKFYHLPLWRANDITSWMVGLNSAMMKIDELFHQFALRTGIDSAPEELVTQVETLTRSVDALLEWQEKASNDITGTNKIVTGVLGQLDIINEKIRQLNFNYSNLDTRMLTVETSQNNAATQTDKLVENVDALTTTIAELTARVEKLENPDDSSTDEPSDEPSEDGEEP